MHIYFKKILWLCFVLFVLYLWESNFYSKGDQSWVFFGKNDAKAETPVLWPPLAKSWLMGKDSDAGRDWGQEEKGTTEDEMAGWHRWLDGRTWVSVNSGSWWWTGRPGVLRFMASQRVVHDWATEVNWTDWCFSFWLTSLCIIGSSFIHLIRTDSNVFFLMAE